ncbi:MAG: hypothetical protein ACREOO_25035, partial [bacterium]
FCTAFVRQKNFHLFAMPRMRAIMNSHYASGETGSMQLVPRIPRKMALSVDSSIRGRLIEYELSDLF